MSHDVVADALNMIKNAKRAGKEIIKINRISNLLIEVLKIMKQENIGSLDEIRGVAHGIM